MQKLNTGLIAAAAEHGQIGTSKRDKLLAGSPVNHVMSHNEIVLETNFPIIREMSGKKPR